MPSLPVDMKLVDQDAHDTFGAISRAIGALLREGNVEKTPEVEAILTDISTLVVYALGTRKYRKDTTVN